MLTYGVVQVFPNNTCFGSINIYYRTISCPVLTKK